MKRRIDYTYINPRLQALISRLLTDEQIAAMDRASTIPELLYLLKETEYRHLAEIYTETGDTNMVELELLRHHRSIFTDLTRHSPEEMRPVIDAFSREVELSILLSALRLWFDQAVRGRSIGDFISYIPGEVSWRGITPGQLINAETVTQLVSLLEMAGFIGTGKAAVPRLREELERVEELEHLYRTELAVDSAYYTGLLEAAGELAEPDRSILIRLTAGQIDAKNTGRMIRGAGEFSRVLSLQDRSEIVRELGPLLIPGGSATDIDQLAGVFAAHTKEGSKRESREREDARRALFSILTELGIFPGPPAELRTKSMIGQLTALEHTLKVELVKEARRFKRADPFTIGTLAAYLLLKKHDIETVRSLMHATYYGLPWKEVSQL